MSESCPIQVLSDDDWQEISDQLGIIIYGSWKAAIESAILAKLADRLKYAERYAWLRDEADCDDGAAVMRNERDDWGNWYWLPVTGDSLDKEVDAAIDAQISLTLKGSQPCN